MSATYHNAYTSSKTSHFRCGLSDRASTEFFFLISQRFYKNSWLVTVRYIPCVDLNMLKETCLGPNILIPFLCKLFLPK